MAKKSYKQEKRIVSHVRSPDAPHRIVVSVEPGNVYTTDNPAVQAALKKSGIPEYKEPKPSYESSKKGKDE